jgi:hypothetical protein
LTSAGSTDQLKKVLDLKNSLESTTKKYMELKHHTLTGDASDSCDSDFEEVEEKVGYEEKAHEDVPISGLSTGTVCGIKKCDTTAGSQSNWNIRSEENSETVLFCMLVIPILHVQKYLLFRLFNYHKFRHLLNSCSRMDELF